MYRKNPVKPAKANQIMSLPFGNDIFAVSAKMMIAAEAAACRKKPSANGE